jgi:hypothetical protein
MILADSVESIQSPTGAVSGVGDGAAWVAFRRLRVAVAGIAFPPTKPRNYGTASTSKITIAVTERNSKKMVNIENNAIRNILNGTS